MPAAAQGHTAPSIYWCGVRKCIIVVVASTTTIVVVTVREKKVRLRSMEQLKRVGNPSNEKW